MLLVLIKNPDKILKVCTCTILFFAPFLTYLKSVLLETYIPRPRPPPPPLELNSLAAPKCVEGVITGYCMCQGKVRAQPGGNFVGEAKELN